MTTISIALATYNGERFLREQLESLAQQSRLPDELVVSDDGSTDGTLDIVRDFAAHVPFPVRIFRNETRLGWRGNFMKAAALCRGQLISFCDQDDIWYTEKVDVVCDLFSDSDALIVYHDADVIDANRRIVGTLRGKERDSLTIPPRTRPTIWSYPAGLTITFRRSLLKFHPYWRLSVDPRDVRTNAAHDQWFYYLASNLGVVRYTPKRLLGYRQHENNAVGFDTKKRMSTNKVGWNSAQDAYIKVLERFCLVLEQAYADRATGFEYDLIDAILLNKKLLQRLRLNRLVHLDLTAVRRADHLLTLMRERAFSRKTDWNLGYKSLMKALIVGIPAGQ